MSPGGWVLLFLLAPVALSVAWFAVVAVLHVVALVVGVLLLPFRALSRDQGGER